MTPLLHWRNQYFVILLPICPQSLTLEKWNLKIIKISSSFPMKDFSLLSVPSRKRNFFSRFKFVLGKISIEKSCMIIWLVTKTQWLKWKLKEHKRVVKFLFDARLRCKNHVFFTFCPLHGNVLNLKDWRPFQNIKKQRMHGFYIVI